MKRNKKKVRQPDRQVHFYFFFLQLNAINDDDDDNGEFLNQFYRIFLNLPMRSDARASF